MQEQTLKITCVKKRVNVGTRWAHPILIDLFIRKVLKMPKSVALSWFYRYRAFDTIIPSKSYAQALQNKSTVPAVENIANVNSKTKEKHFKNSFHVKVLSSTARRVTNDTTPLTVAGVPVKYGKCVPSKYSVPSTPSTVTLYNRFQCLQDLCASTDDMIPNDIHTIKSVEKHRDNSVHVSAVGDKLDHVKQRSGE